MKRMNLFGDREELSVASLVKGAVKDRFALIIPEEWEAFAASHIAEILDEYPCTGILVDRKGPGITYHRCFPDVIDKILEEGIRPCTNEFATFGAGVIYTYPTKESFKFLSSDFGLFEIRYTNHCLQSIVTVDKREEMQGEMLIFPEDVVSIKLVKRW